MKQFIVTVAMGKRLIGKGMVRHPEIVRVLEKGMLFIVGGSTNGYVAEEILQSLGQAEGFSRYGFRRGLKVPPDATRPEVEFPGEIVIENGTWVSGKPIAEVAKQLKEGDVVLKGANAFDARGQAAVQIGSTVGGTILAVLPAVIGRRVQLIVPVGLEKRVFEEVNLIVQRINAPGAEGPRMFPLPGRIFTELEAIQLLTGAQAHLLAAGGAYGAEGSLWLGITGSGEQIQAAADLIESVSNEPPCEV
jgi:hypothetical protein